MRLAILEVIDVVGSVNCASSEPVLESQTCIAATLDEDAPESESPVVCNRSPVTFHRN